MPRDYISEMRRIIDAETGDGPYVSRIAAGHIVDKLRATDPDLLDGWLKAQAEQMVWQTINDRDRSIRAYARRAAKAGEFATDAATGQLVRWLTVPFVVADGTRRRLADLGRDDLLFVSKQYEARAHDNRLTAAFLKAIAKKVGTATVADVYTDAQLNAMWNSLAGGSR